jgi:hypothetical protein
LPCSQFGFANRSGINEPLDLFLTQYRGHPPLTLRKRNVIGKTRSPECLDEEKTQSGSATFDGARRELAITKQVNLVFADVVWTEAVRRTAEVLRKILHRMDVGTNRVLRVVATLKFVQHQLPEMGHSDLLVTQTLHRQQC